MAQQPFNPVSGVSTHLTFRNIFNANAAEAESRISGLESVSGNADWDATSGYAEILNKPAFGDITGSDIADFAAASHTHSLADLTQDGATDGQAIVWNTGSGAWIADTVVGGGAGDMLAATYDPTNVTGDAFDMDNMVEGATTKILTDVERTKLGNITVTGAVNLDDDFATSGQGALADSALQSGDNISLLTNDENYGSFTQQSISSVSSGVTLDNSLGGNADITLTEDVTGLSIINSTSGNNGLIIVKQDNTAGWTFASSYDVLVGDLADIASITPSGSGASSIGWYDDGSDFYLYVSNFT